MRSLLARAHRDNSWEYFIQVKIRSTPSTPLLEPCIDIVSSYEDSRTVISDNYPGFQSLLNEFIFAYWSFIVIKLNILEKSMLIVKKRERHGRMWQRAYRVNLQGNRTTLLLIKLSFHCFIYLSIYSFIYLYIYLSIYLLTYFFCTKKPYKLKV